MNKLLCCLLRSTKRCYISLHGVFTNRFRIELQALQCNNANVNSEAAFTKTKLNSWQHNLLTTHCFSRGTVETVEKSAHKRGTFIVYRLTHV